jgi:hypothetical protein
VGGAVRDPRTPEGLVGFGLLVRAEDGDNWIMGPADGQLWPTQEDAEQACAKARADGLDTVVLPL